MMTRQGIAGYLAGLAIGVLFLSAANAFAVQISVPSAPGVNYMLISTTTGQYIATTTLNANFITGGITNAQLINSSFLTSYTGSTLAGDSSVNLGGTFTLGINLTNANTWTGLQKFAGNGTTTVAQGFEVGTKIITPWYSATSTTNASQFPYASSTAITVTNLFPTNSTTTNEAITRISSQILYANNIGSIIGSSTITTAFGGTGSTTPLGGILLGDGSSPVKSVIVNAPLTLTGTALACVTATGSVTGCLAAADFATFNAKPNWAWNTQPSYFSQVTESTSSTLWLTNANQYGLAASSTYVTYASSSVISASVEAFFAIASTTSLIDSQIRNALHFGDATGTVIGTSTLAWNYGGTGLNTAGTPGQVLSWSGNTGAPAWVASSSVSGAGTPGGTGTEIQYRSGASTFGALTPSSYDTNEGDMLFGTSTATGVFNYGLFTLGSSTEPQLVLTDNNPNDPLWAFRASGGSLTIASSTMTATTSNSGVFVLSQNGSLCIGPSCTSPGVSGLFIRDQDGSGPSLFMGGNDGGDTDWKFMRTANNNSINDDPLTLGTVSTQLGNPSTFLVFQASGGISMSTSTPKLGVLTVGSTSPQLVLTDNVAANPLWAIRAAGNSLFFATSTATATSTTPNFLFDGINGGATAFGYPNAGGTSTAFSIANLAGATSSAVQLNFNVLASTSATTATTTGAITGVLTQQAFNGGPIGSNGDLVFSALRIGVLTEGARLTSSGNFGIATNTPGTKLSIGGIANFTAATSSIFGSGLSINTGCYSIAFNCIAFGNIAGQLNLASAQVTGTLSAQNGGTGATSLGPTFSVVSNVLSSTVERGFQQNATSSGGTWQPGTTTRIRAMATSTTITGVLCYTGVQNTFFNVQLGNGVSSSTMFMASSSATFYQFSTALVITAPARLFIDFGTTTIPIDPKYLSCDWLQRS